MGRPYEREACEAALCSSLLPTELCSIKNVPAAPTSPGRKTDSLNAAPEIGLDCGLLHLIAMSLPAGGLQPEEV